MKVPKPAGPSRKLFDGLTPRSEGVTSRLVFGNPAAFVHGNMFFGVFGEQVFVRLSDADRAVAEKTPGFAPFEPMPGRPMRGYLVLPKSVLLDSAESRRWVARALDYASGLPAKKPPAAAR